MLNFALNYLKHGFSVIPLRPRGKEPLIPWTEFQKRRASEAEVKSWFVRWPEANIGIVSGKISGIAVIDLDGTEGFNSCSALGLVSTCISITGRGKHLWYKLPSVQDIVTNAVRIKPGIDIRGEGGFVVAPPSIHESGRRYRWLRNFPATIVDLPNFPLKIDGTNAPSATVPIQHSKEDWISKALKEMKNGNIDDTLFTICSRLRADGYGAGDALVLLKPHADRAGATPGHLEDKIENVWARYEPNEKRSVGSLPLSNDDPATAPSETIEDFMSEEEPISWLVPGLIAEKSLGFVVGLPETNKTWMLLDLAIEASVGGKWLGIFPVKLSRVWVVDQERFRGETKRRFKALLAGRGTSAKSLENLRVNSGNTTFKLDLDHSFAAFRKRLEEFKPDLVIIDSLATFHTKEENNRMEIQKVLERIKSLRNEFGCTFLFIHHENKMSFQSKEEGKEPSLAEMAGNIALPAAAETVLTVRKRIDGSSLVYHVKSTMAKPHRPFEVRVTDLAGPEAIEVKGYL